VLRSFCFGKLGSAFWDDVHSFFAVAMLLDVDDEDFAIWEDVSPGFGGHVGDNDERLLGGESFDFGGEVVCFSIRCALCFCEEGEGIAPSLGVEGGLRFPGEEIGMKSGGDADAAEVAEGAADEREGALEEVGADEGVVGAEAVEDDGGFTGAEAGGIVFADTGAAALRMGADGGGPVDLLGSVTGTVGAEAARFAGGIARLEACAIPGVIKFSSRKKFMGDEGFWKDEDFLRDGGFLGIEEESEGER